MWHKIVTVGAKLAYVIVVLFFYLCDWTVTRIHIAKGGPWPAKGSLRL